MIININWLILTIDVDVLATPHYYSHDINPQLNKTTKKWLKGATAIIDTRYCEHQSLVLRVSVIMRVDYK